MDVKFIRTTQNKYNSLSPPTDGIFYYCADTERAFLGDIEISDSDAIQHIKVNGTEQEIADQTVDISVPTKVGELENDVPYATEDGLVEAIFGATNYTAITDNTDLNDYMTPGFYYGSASTMQSLDNRPITIANYSVLFVIKVSANRVIQFIFEHGTGTGYFRLCNSSRVFSYWHTVFGSKRVGITGMDLNDFVQEGTYWFQTSTSPVNTPEAAVGFVRVTRCYPDTSVAAYIVQEWQNLYNSNRYWRCCNAGRWSAWELLKFTASYDADSETLALS